LRVVSYYFLAYPDSSPVDPTLAASELYVEVGEEGDTIEHHQGTYGFHVYTFRYVQQEFIDKCRPMLERSVMIVPTLADDWFREFLNANVDLLPRLGELH
jgi:hypothetical protein